MKKKRTWLILIIVAILLTTIYYVSPVQLKLTLKGYRIPDGYGFYSVQNRYDIVIENYKISYIEVTDTNIAIEDYDEIQLRYFANNELTNVQFTLIDDNQTITGHYDVTGNISFDGDVVIDNEIKQQIKNVTSIHLAYIYLTFEWDGIPIFQR